MTLKIKFKCLFGSLVAVAFQNVFHVEMYQNNIYFLFFKFIFKINTSKQFKIYKKLNFNKKNNFF